MQRSMVVASTEVMSSCGLVEAEIYEDGEFVLFAPGGNVAVQFDAEATSALNTMFLKTRAGNVEVSAANEHFSEFVTSCVAEEVVTKTAKVIPRAVGKDENGWGANVSSSETGVVRYFYSHRDLARQADVSHSIGEAGRIA